MLIISDASVLIDIECGELTSAMFHLPFQFAVPDILFVEELAQKHEHLLQFGLAIKAMNGNLISEAYDLHQQYPKPSVNDMLALTLAKHECCQLLTGDKALREVAEQLGVEVHGSIWLVEQMLHHKKTTIDAAYVAFNRMKEAGSRLPWREVEKIFFHIKK